MNIVIAMDSFKNCLPSEAAGEAVAQGIHAFNPEIVTSVFTMADGGEGTLATIQENIGGTVHVKPIVDDFNRNRTAQYLETEIDGVATAVIESAQAVALAFSEHMNNQARYEATSFGLGQLILDAIVNGNRRVIVTLGGSGTTDAGLGMLQALGAVIYDDQDHIIPNGVNPLIDFGHIDLTKAQELVSEIDLEIAPDVSAPLTGKQGAALLFGKQKGLNEQQVRFLNQKSILFANQLKQDSGQDAAALPGAGAAGGIGTGLYALGAIYKQSGFMTLAELTGVGAAIQQSDLVITGEGRLDQQTQLGKVPAGMAELAHKYQKPIIALVGQRQADLGELEKQFDGILTIQLGPLPLQSALTTENATKGLQTTAKEVLKIFTLR
ncbi:glycerate kinase [Lactobacillus sp. CC-MHH1034]|uniref:glycerate kinase family protein n=1 Tax=Agrilactobacillus fermenti TaxID=2586909 RepID=UPI001E2D2A77|nr:glycerate kinase [Agrilactobacillus fermenti]MCD2255571.1 glycerate kinase [Agrilactobacillus fermenti]